MKTSDLIGVLATGAGPAPRAVVARRLVPAALAGALIAAAAALMVLGSAVPSGAAADSMFWAKIGYPGLLVLATGWLTARLCRPAASAAAPCCSVAVVVGGIAVLGALSLWAVPAGERGVYLLGHSWFSCPWSVLGLSLPALAGSLWAVRGMAPTRPRLAGMAAGLFAGALGSLGYSLSCPEASMAFVATWYSCGIALTGALGAALGPRVLRW
jgi:hypothetical protein